jgi:P-type Ca2+ transporter type 2C
LWFCWRQPQSSLATGDIKSAIAILAIVLLNAVLGFVEEYRAEQAIAALKKLASPNAKVRRDDRFQQVPVEDLVPGDIVSFDAGDLIVPIAGC